MPETKRLCWQDVRQGMDLPPLAKVSSTQMLVKWAGASGDFNPIHYEDTFASTQGVGKPIIHGQLKRAWLMQMLTDWIGPFGRIVRFSCQFRGIDHARPMKTITDPTEGETHFCRGKVTKVYEEGGSALADCDIWVENGKGERTTLGNATVALPKRSD